MQEYASLLNDLVNALPGLLIGYAIGNAAVYKFYDNCIKCGVRTPEEIEQGFRKLSKPDQYASALGTYFALRRHGKFDKTE